MSFQGGFWNTFCYGILMHIVHDRTSHDKVIVMSVGNARAAMRCLWM